MLLVHWRVFPQSVEQSPLQQLPLDHLDSFDGSTCCCTWANTSDGVNGRAALDGWFVWVALLFDSVPPFFLPLFFFLLFNPSVFIFRRKLMNVAVSLTKPLSRILYTASVSGDNSRSMALLKSLPSSYSEQAVSIFMPSWRRIILGVVDDNTTFHRTTRLSLPFAIVSRFRIFVVISSGSINAILFSLHPSSQNQSMWLWLNYFRLLLRVTYGGKISFGLNVRHAHKLSRCTPQDWIHYLTCLFILLDSFRHFLAMRLNSVHGTAAYDR